MENTLQKGERSAALSLFASLLFLSISYRIYLFFSIMETTIDPLYIRLTALTFGLFADLLVNIVSVVGFVLFHLLLNILNKKHSKKITYLLLILFFTASLSIYALNAKMLELLFIRLNYTMLLSYFNQGTTALSLDTFVSILDVIFLLSVTSFFAYAMFLPGNRLKKMTKIMLASYLLVIIFGAALFSMGLALKPSSRFITLFSNPVENIISSYYKSFNHFNNPTIAVYQPQLQSVSLIDPGFIKKHRQSASPVVSSKKKLNVVVFVLESVARQYIFKKANNQTPMPFLKKLSKQGLWFENHYSTGNISALGQFSIFTGLYPNPVPLHFEMQEGLKVPTMATWLGKEYDSFLVSASNNLYFSMGVNNTFKEYVNASGIEPNSKNLFFKMFLDENKGVDYFINRLDKAKPPFFGVYWSGAAHYPYKDYSSQFSIKSNVDNRYSRYVNALRLLDSGIEKVFNELKRKGELENTIFIVVGDHGEAFGDIHQAWVHGRTLYQEEIHVPLLVYAPKIFKPEVVTRLTSSVDILPTVLNTMGVSYGDKLQGELLTAPKHLRNYIFVYGDQDDIAAIDEHGVKTQVSFSGANCRRFDLVKDPLEYKPGKCLDKQVQAILKFRYYQPKILDRVTAI